jgi:hypothetical protein
VTEQRTGEVLDLLEELIEAHQDTIEMLVSPSANQAADLRHHVEYLKVLTRATYAVLARAA